MARKVEGESLRTRAVVWGDRLRGQCEEGLTEGLEQQRRAVKCEE